MSRCIRLAVVVPFMLLTIPVGNAQQKKRVAVMDFEYGTVRSSVAAIWGTDQDVGKGISDLLVQKLVQDGKYSVIERNALDKILKEQNFSNSDRADSSTAAKIGRVLGVDAIIIGSITKFGRDDKNTTVGGGGFGGITGKFGIGGVQKRDAKAVCAISARLVDTTTGEILAAVTGDGESKRSGTSLVGAGGSSGGAGGGGMDMSNKNFSETLLGEAVTQAVTSVGAQLDNDAANLPTVTATYSGLVADVSGATLILNVGSKNGVKVGDKIEISRQIRTVKDPATGKVLKVITNKIGEATVTEVDEGSATATFAGSGAAKVGDVANNE
ncbi:MAG TPA: CsgG/HfaB family protein [Terriglobales bacterium]|nr:CsgG/HfaB family protein [Terriglobales bacterium]